MKSTKEVGYSFFSAGATTGMPMRPVVGLGSTVDWAKDGGKYDVTKTVGSNIVGSTIEAKFGNSFATLMAQASNACAITITNDSASAHAGAV